MVSLLAGLPSAQAHNGIGAAFKGHPGNYIVWAYDGDVLSKTMLEYRLIVINGRTQDPIYNVHVRVTATGPGEPSAVATVTAFGNVFFYDLPNPYPGHWLMHLSLSGSLGNAKVEYRMHGAPPRAAAPVIVVTPASTPWGPIVGGGLSALAVAAAAVVWARRRRLRAAGARAAFGQRLGGSAPQGSPPPERLARDSTRQHG